MSFRALPARHWRSYGDDKLPTGAEALDEPFSAFPSWFLHLRPLRQGAVLFVPEVHAGRWRDRLLRQILSKMRHDGCGGRAGAG
jgi:hypothetical protein